MQKNIKKNNYLYLVFSLLLLFSECKKPVTKPVKFTSTTYETLGAYDSSGKPDYLVGRDTISPFMLSFIQNTLPDQRNLTISHPELFTNSAIADITITQLSDVYITFVSEGGGLTNSIAFYTYPTIQPPTSAADIKLITYVFPNSGNLTPLQPGDKVKIGRFEPGTSVGFVLMQNAWNLSTKTLNNDVVHFCSDDPLNPEVDPRKKKHAVLINYTPTNKVLIGFEDTDRTLSSCDNDFNDVVIYCTLTPS